MSRCIHVLVILGLTAGTGLARAQQTTSTRTVRTVVPATEGPQYVSPSGTRYSAEPDSRGLVFTAQGRVSENAPRGDNLMKLGDAYAAIYDYRAAIEAYTRAIAIEPEDAALYQRRGHRRLAIREFDLAAKDLEQAVAIDERLPNAWFYLGITHYIGGRFDKAAECFDRVLDANRNDVASALPALDWLYLSLKRAKMDPKAAAVLERIGPDTTVEGAAALSLSRLMFYKGLRTEAELLAAAKDDTERATLAYAMGAVHLAAGRDQDAMRLFKMAVATNAWSSLAFIAAERDLTR